MNARRRIAGSNGAALAGLAGCLVLLVGLGSAAPAVRAEGPEIVIHDGAFDPPAVTVHVGEAVSWTNASSRSVDVITADSTLDSGEIAPGAGFTHVFDAPGTVDYYVGGDPRVRGEVVVEGDAAAGGGTSPLVMVGVALLAIVAVGAAIVTLIGAAGRQRRAAPPD
jgi:plastocyanin